MGCVTASMFSEVLSKGTGRNTYMMKLLAERMTGVQEESYTNKYMEWGTEIEPQAKAYYSQLNNRELIEVGFVKNQEWVGVSPDAFVGDIGLYEGKGPKSSTHLSYILKNKLPTHYKPQIQGQLWVTGHKWCDFVSFDPRVTDRPYWSVRVLRDEKYIIALDKAVKIFLNELQSKIDIIKSKKIVF